MSLAGQHKVIPFSGPGAFRCRVIVHYVLFIFYLNYLQVWHCLRFQPNKNDKYSS